jgi:hypothetical protein
VSPREERPPREARPPRERKERAPLEPGQSRLYFNLGRRDGVDEAAVAALLAEKGVTPIRSELHTSHTYLIVAETEEPGITAALTGLKHGERDLVCERARK